MDNLKVYCPACGTISDPEILNDVIAPSPDNPVIQCPHCNVKYALQFVEVDEYDER